jgi:hypothetical protein
LLRGVIRSPVAPILTRCRPLSQSTGPLLIAMRSQSANDSAPPDKGAETSDDRKSKQPKMAVAVPGYDGSALAREVFSDPVFYDGDEEVARYH